MLTPWLGRFTCGALLGALAVGCTPDLATSDRPSPEATRRMRAIAETVGDDRGPIAIAWVPADFPQRVDMQGPGGNEGAVTEAAIPTGVGLSGRIVELLDGAVGVWADARTVVTIYVIEAQTEYAYSMGLDRRVASARSVLDAEFDAGDVHWQERFEAKARGDARGAGPIDRVWDDVALQVARSVLEHLPDTNTWAYPTEAGSDPVPPPTEGDAGADPFFAALTVTSNVPAAEVYVNGLFVGDTGSLFRLPPGDYVIEVQAEGQRPYRRDLHVLAGSEVTIHADLRP